MRLTAGILFLTVLMGNWPAFAQDNEKPEALHYAVSPRAGDPAKGLAIAVSFLGDADGTTTIILPNHWAGQENLWEDIRALRVSKGKAQLHETDTPHIYLLTHEPGVPITLTYSVIHPMDSPPLPYGGALYRPQLTADYVHFIGSNVFVIPEYGNDSGEADEETPERLISFEWRNFPPDWKFTSSFSTKARQEPELLQVSSFKQAVFVAGDVRLRQENIGGATLNLALRGAWAFSDDEVVQSLRQTLSAGMALWQNQPFKHFTVTLMQDASASGSIGGTGLTNSFATYASSDATLAQLQNVLSHEFLHEWLPGEVGSMSVAKGLGPSLYWFSEGFTDYYTGKILRAGGMIDDQGYADRLNKILRTYWFSPYRNASNKSITEKFWTVAEIGQLPYQRGMLLALKWDAEISAASDGRFTLLDVLHAMIKENLLSKANGDKALPFTPKRLQQAIMAKTGVDISKDLEAVVKTGETIDVPDRLFSPCLVKTIRNLGTLDYGYQARESRLAGIIQGVDPKGAAYAAGLRDGQVFIKYIDPATDLAKPFRLLVRQNDKEIEISYVPMSKVTRPVPQFELATELCQ
ncbi:MAG: hypothetical protein COA85_02700 [Robiginitomaculum sp.]|nr:MAG: hypothetical protein COA85_02700 [Robiginitomaculum sp.]